MYKILFLKQNSQKSIKIEKESIKIPHFYPLWGAYLYFSIIIYKIISCCHVCELHLSFFDNPSKLKHGTGGPKVQNVSPSPKGFIGS